MSKGQAHRAGVRSKASGKRHQGPAKKTKWLATTQKRWRRLLELKIAAVPGSSKELNVLLRPS